MEERYEYMRDLSAQQDTGIDLPFELGEDKPKSESLGVSHPWENVAQHILKRPAHVIFQHVERREPAPSPAFVSLKPLLFHLDCLCP